MSNERMIMNMAYFKVLPKHVPAKIEENHDKPQPT
jgi:hypothetical protein